MSHWHLIESEEDIHRLLQEYNGFHDSCIAGAHFETGCLVTSARAMANGSPDQRILRITFHSQWVSQPLELCFGGVRQFSLTGWQDNYFCEIFDCCLRFQKDPPFSKDMPGILWADWANFSPTDPITILEEPMCSFVIANSLKWRFADA